MNSAAAYCLLSRSRAGLALCILVPAAWAYCLVNPITVGLKPITEAPLFREVRALVEQDPAGRWAVFGPYALADFIKAAGARVVNGTQIVPPLELLRAIDSDGSHYDTYNRYGHVALEPRRGTDIGFKLVYQDSYTIEIDPNASVWSRVGVDYFVLPYEGQDEEFLGRTTALSSVPESGVWIYKARRRSSVF